MRIPDKDCARQSANISLNTESTLRAVVWSILPNCFTNLLLSTVRIWSNMICPNFLRNLTGTRVGYGLPLVVIGATIIVLMWWFISSGEIIKQKRRRRKRRRRQVLQSHIIVITLHNSLVPCPLSNNEHQNTVCYFLRYITNI